MTMNGMPSQSTRRYELDWLRVFAVLMVFVYHSAHFFDVDDWSVKNATTYTSLSWLMALRPSGECR